MRWMPKSDKLYYTVTALSGNDVITLDPATLNEETLLKGIPEQSFTWSPNEDFLIYYPREEGEKNKVLSAVSSARQTVFPTLADEASWLNIT